MYSNNSYNEGKKEPVDVSKKNSVFDTKDFYPIPPHAVERLLEVETFEGLTWECACGVCISKVFERTGHKVFNTDIINREYDQCDKQIDFLNCNLLTSVNNIIINSPYKYAEEFIQRSKQFATDKIAILLKTAHYENQCQYEGFQGSDFFLKAIYPFSQKVRFLRIHNNEHRSGTITYAWYVWERHYSGKANMCIL